MTDKVVIYGIDIGAPGVGFCAARLKLDNKEFFFFDHLPGSGGGWEKCVREIVGLVKNGYQVKIALESPLWGAKFNNKAEDRWTERFTVSDGKKIYSEHPWYTGAGGSTAMMSQLFLQEIQMSIGAGAYRSIQIVESYISGFKRLKGTHGKGTQKSRSYLVRSKLMGKKGHRADALESLFMAFRYFEKNKNTYDFFAHFCKWDEEKWQAGKKEISPAKNTQTFALGVLKNKKVFTLHLGNILLSHRRFKSKS